MRPQLHGTMRQVQLVGCPRWVSTALQTDVDLRPFLPGKVRPSLSALSQTLSNALPTPFLYWPLRRRLLRLSGWFLFHFFSDLCPNFFYLKEKCKWQCDHIKCDHPCFEFCNRDSCTLPCPQRLPCGHLCPGLCGEICPPMCPSCVKPSQSVGSKRYCLLNFLIESHLISFLYSRCIYLSDCGHLVPIDEMDQHIGYHQSASNEKIKAPKCPQCQQRIRLCHGRYADHIKAFYEDNCTARSVYDQDVVLLQDEITKLLVKNSSDNEHELSTSKVEALLKGKSIEEQWRIYEQMYHLCSSAAFKADIDKTYSFSTTVTKKPGTVKLDKSLASGLITRHRAVQTSLLSSSVEFLSIECLKDALAQWRRLDLLRQCLTMESVKPKSSTSKTCHQLLKNAKLVLENSRDWTSRKERDALAILKSAAALMEFKLALPDSSGGFFHRVTLSVDDWMRCVDCQTVYPHGVRSNCSSAECLLQHLHL